MKNQINIQKVIILFNALSVYKRPDSLKVKDGKLYRATWDVDYHNGDIDNYEETPVKEADAEKWVGDLERKYAEQQWEAYVEMEKKGFVQRLYTFSVFDPATCMPRKTPLL